VEWSLDGPLPKLCPVIPTSNQDGRQAKNTKRGDEIKKKNSPLKLLNQSQPNYAPSSSLLQGKHLSFSPSPLRLNIFRLFVILSLNQLYRYTPDIL
jgi:hypothetical protein